MAQAGGGGGGGWGTPASAVAAPNGGGGGWGAAIVDGAQPLPANINRIYNVDQVSLPFVTYADGSTDGWGRHGGGWGLGEHCDDKPAEIQTGWAPRSLDDPWIPGGRLWQGPLQRGEDDSFRGYQR